MTRDIKVERVPRNKLFMQIAELMSQRSTCIRNQVGCVITRDNRIITSGYNGAPSGMRHCSDGGCEIGSDGGCKTTLHAEIAAITFAAKHGIALEGCTLYTTLEPCYDCAKAIINAGIKKVIYKNKYRDSSGTELLTEAGIMCSWYIPGVSDRDG